MPVRIVLRGLILMSVKPDDEDRKKGSITARLINGSKTLDGAVEASLNRHKGGPEPHANFEECMHEHKGHHKHQGEIQIFDGGKERDQAGLIPIDSEEVAIAIPDTNRDYVRKEQSYNKFMPKLGAIAKGAKMEGPGDLNLDFVSHTVRINRGVVRVRDVGDWDAGSTAIPPRYRDPGSLDDVYQPAKVRFLKADVYGYVATECVIDVEHSDTVTIAGTSLAGTYKGNRKPSLRAAEKTVEILITNYAPQQGIARPWTLHYRWMFEAAGYARPTGLGGPELDLLTRFGEDYDRESWICEKEMFLGDNGATGYPFPYRLPKMWRVGLGDLDYRSKFGTEPGDEFDPASDVRAAVMPNLDRPGISVSDPWDPVNCPMGDCDGGKC